MKFHKFVEKNTKGRDFIVGDVHGHLQLLQDELNKVDFDEKADRLFSVGDLVDRGPQSLETLQLVYEPWFHMVCGNHEEMMLLVVLARQTPMHWYSNGGGWADSVEPKVLNPICEYLDANITLAITIGDNEIGICHAEPPYDWKEVQIDAKYDVKLNRLACDLELADRMLWNRSVLYNKNVVPPIKNIGKTYHGHTPIPEAKTIANMRFIDTGAFYTKKLTVEQIDG